ncbi:MAG: DUF1080 domain-containing protein [Flavobacteriaceae bacterium]|nr:DUF1080 domain-containing protein [Flavobacteriaceae bacterium]
MKNSELYLLFLLALIITGCKDKPKEVESSQEWIEIFNGENLDGWHPKIRGYALDENPWNTFRVVDGAMQVSYDEYEDFDDRFGHIFFKNPYSDYRLKMEYRFIGDQAPGGERWATKNSGIMIHCQSPESMTVDQSFPVSLEVQLLGGFEEGVERPTANLCTPGTHVNMNGEQVTQHCINSNSETFYGEEWIEAEVLVINDSLITHYINGKEVISYSKPVIGGEYNTLENLSGQALTSGWISLQSESHPIEFRNIKLLELKDQP